jgi:hypothetical protein
VQHKMRAADAPALAHDGLKLGKTGDGHRRQLGCKPRYRRNKASEIFAGWALGAGCAAGQNAEPLG